MSERVRMFNRFGYPLTELDVLVPRTWIRNGIGSAEFLMSTFDEKFTREFMEVGNILLIENERLPDWVGRIMAPRSFGIYTAKVVAKSAEVFLQGRRGYKGLKLTGSAGDIVTEVVKVANRQSPTLLKVGSIYTEGTTREESLDVNPLFSDVDRIRKRSGNDWNVTPLVDKSGRLALQVNWYKRMGSQQLFQLEEGKNIEALEDFLIEQGEPTNDLIGYNNTGGEESTLMDIERDEESIARYGVWQGSVSVTNAKEPSQLQLATKTVLNSVKDMTKTVSLNVLDIDDEFPNMGMGNLYPVTGHRSGFFGETTGFELNLEIFGMKYDPANPKRLELILEDQTNDS